VLRGRQILSKDRGKDRIKNDSPCGIEVRANNSILVEEIFHGAKGAKLGETEKEFSLRSWRLGEKIFVEAFC
jgi:hypothetical protein